MPHRIVERQCGACGHPVALVPEEVCPNCGQKETTCTEEEENSDRFLLKQCWDLLHCGGRITLLYSYGKLVSVHRTLDAWAEPSIAKMATTIKAEQRRRRVELQEIENEQDVGKVNCRKFLEQTLQLSGNLLCDLEDEHLRAIVFAIEAELKEREAYYQAALAEEED
jgi:hypothetical protein